MQSVSQRYAKLSANTNVLLSTSRGIEKEGLRTNTNNGFLSQLPHPKSLGSTLAHPSITTDYSEALLELITGVHHNVDGIMNELFDVHSFVSQNIGDEVIWNQSMPSFLPDPKDIPVGWYGTSNVGMLKHVYRLGLAERYGKPMQCIAGIHYNFSLPDAFWDVIQTPGADTQEKRTTGYMDLIRNFMRHSWLLMYLFGASPAASKNFLHGTKHSLDTLDADTLYLPYATSLRMSDIGYQNKAQSELSLCYNDLDTFLARIYNAVTTPWPDYEKIGTHRDGKWIQINTNILQIENEYYSSIRPKRVTNSGERPTTALAQRGIEYVEVRCMDVNPFDPVGISHETSYFMDAFLLFCAMENSPDFTDGGVCLQSRNNYNLAVSQGRKPGLELSKNHKAVKLQDWGLEIMEKMIPYAEILDKAYGGDNHIKSLQIQKQKIEDISLTPSAQLLFELKQSGLSMHDYTMQQSIKHKETLINDYALTPEKQTMFKQQATQSIIQQTQAEASDEIDFDTYVDQYHKSLESY